MKVIIIGAGPAGLMGAISAAEAGCEVIVFEQL
ncbi:MAG: NAD(P)/FAD-dependent oxidoreductase, partial [Victivallales bacterium]|nr:NAD(P)/FAD-dependent oxidoreductase [Victivallales bacterium]